MGLKVEGVSKSFHDTPIIKNFDFHIHPGEIVALVGKSGTGKTTFLRLLNDLERADRGSISIGSHALFQTNESGDVQYAARAARKKYMHQIGFVFQDYQLFPNRTVLENCMEAPLSQKKMNPNQIKNKAETLLTRMQLIDKKDAYPKTLSGGQQQRAAIARALMLEPQLLCFDEPTSALDRESADEVGRLIESIAASGTGILIITHDLPFAEKFSTRMISSKAFLS